MDNSKSYNVDWTKELNEAAFNEFHNLFVNLTKSGFTDKQAIMFLTGMLTDILIKKGQV